MYSQSYVFPIRAVIFVVTTLLWLVPRPAGAQVDLGLAPMRVEFPATPGRSFSGVLTLSNASTNKARIRAELLDVYVDENTTPQFVFNAPGETDFSCRQWISVNPTELEMDGHTQVPVRYTVRVPATAAERSFHCAIGFRTMPMLTEEEGMAMRTAVRVIAAIYPIVGKPSFAGAIKEIKLEAAPDASDGGKRVVVVMDNSGFLLYRPSGQVTLTDADGKVLETLTVAPFPVLPQRQQRFVLPLKSDLLPGSYSLRARIDLGPEIQEASAHVIVQPDPEPAKQD